MKDPKIHTRSSPNSVILAAQELSSDARNVVITAGFEQLLYMSLEGFGNREILRFLMNNTHTEQTSEGVEIKIEGSKLPPITENVVAHVVGVPEGSGESLEFEQDTKKQGEIKKAVHNLLKLPDSVDDCEPIADEKKRDRKHKTIMNGKIGVDYLRDVMEEAKETKDVELEVKCFFFIAFHTLLLPEKDGYLTLHQMQAGMNLARIQRINWRKVLLNHLKDGVKSWWKSQAKSTKPGAKSTKPGGVASVYISGPMTVLLVSIFKTIIFSSLIVNLSNGKLMPTVILLGLPKVKIRKRCLSDAKNLLLRRIYGDRFGAGNYAKGWQEV